MIITFACAKGGVGKTTLATNFAIQKFNEGKNVVLIDLDPQSNISLSFGKSTDKNINNSILSVLKKDKRLEDIVDLNISKKFQEIKKDKKLINDFAIIYSELDLNKYDILINQKKFSNEDLTKILLTLNKKFDFVIIDTAPAMTSITRLILKLADMIFIPFLSDRYSVEGAFLTLDILKSDPFFSKYEQQIKLLIPNQFKLTGLLDQAMTEYISLKKKDYKNLYLTGNIIPSNLAFKKSIATEALPLIYSKSKSKLIQNIKFTFNDLSQEVEEIIKSNSK